MILELLSPTLKSFFASIEELGFSLCLVGGSPRDYLIEQTLGHDFDFEIRPADNLIKKEQWPIYYKKLIHFLIENKIPHEELPYLITKVKFDNVVIEFSSPRLEKNIENNNSHHHFEAVLDPKLSYSDSFKRRDFTFNAIGMIFDFKNSTETWVDPYSGKIDLSEKRIKNITNDFFNDSVRFLRMIRFSIKFSGFNIDPLLERNLKKFNLSELSIYHFKEELKKSHSVEFLNQFKILVNHYQFKIPEDFNIWTCYDFPPNILSFEEIMGYIYLQETPNDKNAKDVLKFFSIKEKRLGDLKSFYQSYKNIEKLSIDDLSIMAKLNFESLVKKSVLIDLKNLEEKKEWKGILKLESHLLIDWSDWENLSFSSEELAEIEFSKRSYYRYFKSLTRKFSHG